MIKKIYYSLFLPLTAWPIMLNAQFYDVINWGGTTPDPDDPGLVGFFSRILNIIDILIIVVFALAFLFFIWGLTIFILQAGEKEKVEEGKRIMIWGVIAFTVMLSLWGIVNLLGNIF